MKVVSQTVLAIEHDESVSTDWNLVLQRLEIETDDVPNHRHRVGRRFDALALRTRDGHQGGGAVGDVQTPLDGLGPVHVVELGDGRYAVIGTVQHDRYSSTHMAVDGDSGRRQCTLVANPDYAVDFFVCLSVEEPRSLHVDISGMDFDFPLSEAG